MATADIWFDPTCPWTWLTARWLVEVERVRQVELRFHVMSLALLDHGEEDATPVDLAWGPVRVVAATGLGYGDSAMRELYLAMAPLIHRDGERVNRDLYARALSRAKLPHTLANAALTTSYDDAIRASHRSGLAPMGGDLGTPILHLRRPSGDVVAFFGPVVNPSPRGEAAGMLWDTVVMAAASESFFELKRLRHQPPSYD